MADSELSNLAAITSLDPTDLLYIAEDLGGGSFASKQITYGNLQSGISVTASQVSDFDTEVSNNVTVAANAAHAAGDGSDHADVASNTSHRTGDGSDHADVASNTSHRTGDGSDHADVAANTFAREQDVNQVAHGLAVEDVIYNNAGTWVKAQADDEDTLGIAIVSAVAGVDDFTLTSVGFATFTTHGYTVGQYLFLSEVTPGALTETEPSGITEFSNPMAYVVDANTLWIQPWRPTQALPRHNDIRIVPVSSTTYNVDDIDEMILADANAGNQEINLPTPSADYNGFVIDVKKVDASINTVTIKSASGNIDGTLGTTGIVISTQWVSYTLACDGANWYIK